MKKKMYLNAVIDDLPGSVIECVREGATKDVLNDLHEDEQEATITFESKQNIVNILNFQLLLIMFNLSTMQAISRGSVGWRERSKNCIIAQVNW